MSSQAHASAPGSLRSDMILPHLPSAKAADPEALPDPGGARAASAKVRSGILAWYILLLTALPWPPSAAGSELQGESLASTQGRLKFLIAAIGILLAVRLGRAHSQTRAERLLVAYAVVAGIGGMFFGGPAQESVLRAIRFGLTVWAIGFLGSWLDLSTMLRHTVYFCLSVCALAVGAYALGMQSLSGKRLPGYLPHLHPNSLGFVAAVGLMAALTLSLQAPTPRWQFRLSLAVFAATALLAQSRTSLLALAIALLVNLALGSFGRAVAIVWVALFILVVAGLVPGTSIGVSAIFERKASSGVDTTFTGRSFAWNVAVHAPRTGGQWLFGRGLSIKNVGVSRKYVKVQTLDGTWYSAIVEAGLVGTGVLAAAVLASFGIAKRMADHVILPMLVLVGIVSVVDSVLNDVGFGTVIFVGLISFPLTRLMQTSPPDDAAAGA
jgi:hypothetical protein